MVRRYKRCHTVILERKKNNAVCCSCRSWKHVVGVRGVHITAEDLSTKILESAWQLAVTQSCSCQDKGQNVSLSHVLNAALSLASFQKDSKRVPGIVEVDVVRVRDFRGLGHFVRQLDPNGENVG